MRPDQVFHSLLDRKARLLVGRGRECVLRRGRRVSGEHDEGGGAAKQQERSRHHGPPQIRFRKALATRPLGVVRGFRILSA